LRLTLLRQIPEDANLRRQWNALVERVPRPQVFYTYEWAVAVQRAYGATLRPLVYVAYDKQGTISGIAALALSDRSEVSFLCATTGDYCDFLSLPKDKSSFVAHVLGELRKDGVGKVTLTNLPADSDTFTAIREHSTANGYHSYARTAYVCTQVLLDRLERRPDGKLVLPRKKMVRRFLNAMGREAPVRLDQARSWDELRPVLPGFMQAHIARFLATGRISNMARPERRMFLEELAKLLSEAGWVTLTRMMSGDKAFAWNYGFQYRDTWFWYQPTFESELEKYSPGFCLLAKLIEDAATTPEIKAVDLGLGAEEYKDRVANQTRRTLYVTLMSSPARHYREVARYNAARVLRSSSVVEHAVRGALRRWSRFRTGASPEFAPRSMTRVLRELFWLEQEVFFYEWQGRDALLNGKSELCAPDLLKPDLLKLDLLKLASATCEYVNDPLTLDYLLRCVSRLHNGTASVYGRMGASGRIIHFVCVSDFDKFFLSELNAKVDAPTLDCVMLFDCWTPTALRELDYSTQALQQIAALMQGKGKRAWSYCQADDVEAVKRLERAGFERRYSLTRQRILGWERIKGETPKANVAAAAEVSARI
jgi:CelD/BcsL family acetyltransferase involved in cellulose biosynthesis